MGESCHQRGSGTSKGGVHVGVGLESPANRKIHKIVLYFLPDLFVPSRDFFCWTKIKEEGSNLRIKYFRSICDGPMPAVCVYQGNIESMGCHYLRFCRIWVLTAAS